MFDFDKAFENVKAPTGKSFPKLDEVGTYTVKILSSEWVKTLAGNAEQGKLQVEVVDGPKKGARCNLYIGEGKTPDQGFQNAKFLWDTLKLLGIPVSKLQEDCTTLRQVINNIIGITQKRIVREDVILLTLNVVKNEKKSTPEKTEFYFNPSVYVAPATPIESLPEATKPSGGSAQITEEWP